MVEYWFVGNNWSNVIVGVGLGVLVFGVVVLSSCGLVLLLGLYVVWNIGDWMCGNKGGGYWVVLVDLGYVVVVECFGLMVYVLVMVMVLFLFEWWCCVKVIVEC